MGYKEYKKAFNYTLNKMRDIRKETDDVEALCLRYKKANLDPDCKGIRTTGGIKCTTDGLLSIKRICFKEQNIDEVISVYEKYRRIPIFLFPCEVGGINQSRATLLEDRIDHTLLDIKHYCDTNRAEECVLLDAYKREKTAKWFNYFYDEAAGKPSFEKIVDWMGIKGIFVDEAYRVINLENPSCTEELLLNHDYLRPKRGSNSEYFNAWSDNYYSNLKDRIDLFMQRYPEGKFD